jgi:hypothetical protein
MHQVSVSECSAYVILLSGVLIVNVIMLSVVLLFVIFAECCSDSKCNFA